MHAIARMTERDCGLGMARDAYDRHCWEGGRQAVLLHAGKEIILPQLFKRCVRDRAQRFHSRCTE